MRRYVGRRREPAGAVAQRAPIEMAGERPGEDLVAGESVVGGDRRHSTAVGHQFGRGTGQPDPGGVRLRGFAHQPPEPPMQSNRDRLVHAASIGSETSPLSRELTAAPGLKQLSGSRRHNRRMPGRRHHLTILARLPSRTSVGMILCIHLGSQFAAERIPRRGRFHSRHHGRRYGVERGMSARPLNDLGVMVRGMWGFGRSRRAAVGVEVQAGDLQGRSDRPDRGGGHR